MSSLWSLGRGSRCTTWGSWGDKYFLLSCCGELDHEHYGGGKCSLRTVTPCRRRSGLCQISSALPVRHPQKHCRSKATKIIKESLHSANCLFHVLFFPKTLQYNLVLVLLYSYILYVFTGIHIYCMCSLYCTVTFVCILCHHCTIFILYILYFLVVFYIYFTFLFYCFCFCTVTQTLQLWMWRMNLFNLS